MSRIHFVAASAAFFLAVPLFTFAAEPGDLRITPAGVISVKPVTVTQISGMNLFTRVQWGDMFIRLTVLLQNDTAVTRKYGGKAVPSDIREGDLLSVEGQLVDGSGNLVIKAKKVIDYSLTNEQKEISGTVTSVEAAKNLLTVSVKSLGATKVALSTETPIKKGVRMITINELTSGDKILSASGIYDYPTKTLNATAVEVYQDKKVFAPRVFEGTIQSIAGTSVPASFVLSSGNSTYTVYVSTSTQLVSKSGSVVALSRLAAGDKVRLNGSIRETNLSEVNATFVRDLAF